MNNSATAASPKLSELNRDVLIVGNFLSSSMGTTGICEDLAKRLAISGWTVLTTSYKQGRLLRLLDMISTAWSKRHQFSVAQVDVYSGRAFFWANAVCYTLRKSGKPYILTLHGGNLPAFAARRQRQMRDLLCSAVAVTTPSRYLIENMRQYRSDLRLLPNPLDIGAYEFKLRRQPRPRLIWLRAFHSIYNPSLAPKVVARLAQDFPETHLTMIGPDRGDGSLQATKQVAMQLGVADRISIVGKVPKAEIPRYINEGDIFLNTTNVDNTPVSVLESMASGLCIVSTNVGGISYLLEDKQDALLVLPDDPDAMANAVRSLCVTPGLAESLSRNARAKVEQFDWSAILPQWEALLTEKAGAH